MDSVRFELAILNGLQNKSKHILQLVGYCDEPSLTIITRYYSNGSLQGLIHRNDFSYDESFILHLALGIVQGMEVVHAANIVHYDLKPMNILLGDKYEAVISDFGVSNLVGDTGASGIRLVAGISNPRNQQQQGFTPGKGIPSVNLAPYTL